MFVGDGSAWRSDTGPVLERGQQLPPRRHLRRQQRPPLRQRRLVSTGPNATMATNAGANVMRFGAYSTGPGQYWPGTLDDASFYPAVLTPTQVQAHYNASITGSQATSAATATVTTPAAPVNTPPPTVSGPGAAGANTDRATGSWSGTTPISYSDQWQRCSPGCGDISGAERQYLPVAAADVGATLRVAVTASNSSGSSHASSTQTAGVTAAGTATTVTFDITTGADDGEVKANNMGTGAPYPPATTPTVNTTATTFAVQSDTGPVFSGYEVRVGLLRFDTSALPDGATVTGATLRLYVTGTDSDNGRSLVGEWYSAANWPIDSGDYSLNAAATAHAGTAISSLTVNSRTTSPSKTWRLSRRPDRPDYGYTSPAAPPTAKTTSSSTHSKTTTTTAPNRNSRSLTRALRGVRRRSTRPPPSVSGAGAAGADADRRPGQLVGHRTDLLQLSVAAV